MKVTFRRAWLAALVFSLVAIGTVNTPHALAQLSLASSPSAAERELEYAALAKDVEALEQQLSVVRRVVQLAQPTVVHIDAKKPPASDARPGRKPIEEAGSGVVIEAQDKFFVVTNRHVIDSAPLPNITIKLADGRLLHPTNVWADRETDVAVMAIEAEDLTAARLGDSDKLEIGDFVIAVGSPFGLSHSVTYGIISAKSRRDLELGDGSIRYQDFLQTDAAINPGNSGGPLLNLRGEVIGINTAIASSSGGSEGIGFTIPINMANMVAEQFIQHGRPVRAFLGVNLNKMYNTEQATRLGLPRVRGALVEGVFENSPAATAEFHVDDVVLRFDGRDVEDDDHLIKIVGFTPVGKAVDVVIFRAGQLVTLKVTLTEKARVAPRQ